MDSRIWVATGSDDGLAKVWEHNNEFRDRPNSTKAECVATLFGHQAGITSMEWNPHEDTRKTKDEQPRQHLLTSSKDQTLKVWKPFAKNGPTHRTIPEPVKPDVDDAGLAKQKALPTPTNKHSDYINMACWRAAGPDAGQQILSCSDDGTAAIWDWRSGELKHRLGGAEGLGHSSAVSMASWSSDGGRILTCSQDQSCIAWSPKNGHHIKIFPPQPNKDRWKAHWGPIWSALFSPDGHEVVTASKDGSARVWDCNTGQCALCLHDKKCADASQQSPDPASHSDIVFGACFNPFSDQGNQVLTCSMDGTAKLWDKRDQKVTQLIDQHQGAVWSAVFGNDRNSGGRMILTTSHDMTAQVFDQRLAMPKNILVGHTGILWQASFNEDDQYVVTCSEDRTARLWNLSTGERRPQSIRLMDPVYPHKQAVTCAAFRPPVMLENHDAHHKH